SSRLEIVGIDLGRANEVVSLLWVRYRRGTRSFVLMTLVKDVGNAQASEHDANQQNDLNPLPEVGVHDSMYHALLDALRSTGHEHRRVTLVIRFCSARAAVNSLEDVFWFSWLAG